VRVTRVVGAPAMEAGLKVDDVIVAWNGEKVDDFMDLSLKISRTAVNAKVQITIRRGEEELSLQVTVGQREAKQ
jgi:S1-C subfamily serine protease